MVRALGLHAAAPGSNPVPTSGYDLFPVAGFNSTALCNNLNCLDYERRHAVKTGILRKVNAKWGAFIRENAC